MYSSLFLYQSENSLCHNSSFERCLDFDTF